MALRAIFTEYAINERVFTRKKITNRDEIASFWRKWHLFFNILTSIANEWTTATLRPDKLTLYFHICGLWWYCPIWNLAFITNIRKDWGLWSRPNDKWPAVISWIFWHWPSLPSKTCFQHNNLINALIWQYFWKVVVQNA